MTAASRFQRANGSTGSGLSALGGFERSESGAYRGPFGAAGEDPDHDYAAVMTGEAYSEMSSATPVSSAVCCRHRVGLCPASGVIFVRCSRYCRAADSVFSCWRSARPARG